MGVQIPLPPLLRIASIIVIPITTGSFTPGMPGTGPSKACSASELTVSMLFYLQYACVVIKPKWLRTSELNLSI